MSQRALLITVALFWAACGDSNNPATSGDDKPTTDEPFFADTAVPDASEFPDTTEPGDTENSGTENADSLEQEPELSDAQEPDVPNTEDTGEPDDTELPDVANADSQEQDAALSDAQEPDVSNVGDTGEPDSFVFEDIGEPDVPNIPDAGEPDSFVFEDIGEPDVPNIPDAGEPDSFVFEDIGEPDVPNIPDAGEPDTGVDVCTPQCKGKTCGPNGCGGQCGTCVDGKEACKNGSCECAPNCDNVKCGDDGCGGSCGICACDPGFVLKGLACVPDGPKSMTIPGTSGLKIPYYRNHAIGKASTKFQRALIVVHGSNRNADDYFSYGYAAAQSAGVASDTLIIAPRFEIPADNPKSGFLYWDYNNHWKIGHKSTDLLPVEISSFAVMDTIMEKITAGEKFPNISEIILIGHSAGGQFINRYASGSTSVDKLPIPVRYVVANPSSYLYLNQERPIAGFTTQFEVPDSTSCPNYNKYKYGFGTLNAYMSGAGATKIIQQYELRKVVYLLGSKDNQAPSDTNLVDDNCAAMLQGPNRLARGDGFYNYLAYFYGAPTHAKVIVQGVGHSAKDMFASPEGLNVIFSGVADGP